MKHSLALTALAAMAFCAVPAIAAENKAPPEATAPPFKEVGPNILVYDVPQCTMLTFQSDMRVTLNPDLQDPGGTAGLTAAQDFAVTPSSAVFALEGACRSAVEETVAFAASKNTAGAESLKRAPSSTG